MLGERKQFCVRQGSNAGAMFREYAEPRGGAQINFCDGKSLIEGESLTGSKRPRGSAVPKVKSHQHRWWLFQEK
ncbi:MAG: hypothetical protein A3C84_03295 [Candidatus Ryanbacteria bacterium RIFCSPHIGHO2_02_FULL_48_12]|uniref:Uncharacterized protein n=1 Tax=Candidatus Ryanbacteria bacterium RIFCSPHIGHO2_01_FULL_48_27 TaxID=1802115 RepID=A0A1G2G6H2_9BACT|nr:MAG: hypothetical protein A2756_02725 [Candidatus Ryanbacteria bacterium RIFCSPHIGHO2_01_FULL_48_27]OGZ49952.1 MAG: hypothetical protein A3C84_03295 [Candidatus Ryanbacteria bacterium RIFCSPHIGHO2_02_FULL_48_12]